MARVRLSVRQKMLLRTLVHYDRQGRLNDFIAPYPSSTPGEFSIHVLGGNSLIIQGTQDLDYLCQAGLLRLRWDRSGFAKLYGLTAASYRAVEMDFREDGEEPEGHQPDFDLGAILHAMSGGQVFPEAPGSMDSLQATVAHPSRRDDVIDFLVTQLVAAVAGNLPHRQRVAYDKTARILRDELKSAHVNPPLLRQLIANLALMGDIEGSLGLAGRAWPFLYPLLLVLAGRLQDGGGGDYAGPNVAGVSSPRPRDPRPGA